VTWPAYHDQLVPSSSSTVISPCRQVLAGADTELGHGACCSLDFSHEPAASQLLPPTPLVEYLNLLRYHTTAARPALVLALRALIHDLCVVSGGRTAIAAQSAVCGGNRDVRSNGSSTAEQRGEDPNVPTSSSAKSKCDSVRAACGKECNEKGVTCWL
jgi:hypothetical protein